MSVQQQQTRTDEDSNWERFRDLQKYFFESGFKDNGSNPESRLYSFFKPRTGLDEGDWTNSPLRSTLYGFLQFAPDNKLVVDISFESATGYSLVLARAFYEVITVHFNEHYHNVKEVCRDDKYQTNYRTLTLPVNIFSHVAGHIHKCERMIYDAIRPPKSQNLQSIDMLVIGPVKDRSKIVSINLLIEKLYDRKLFTQSAVLLSVRPLMIGSKPRIDIFKKYNPPGGIFEDITDTEVKPKLESFAIPFHYVNSKGIVQDIDQHVELPYGLEVICDSVTCIFEFRVYKCIGRYSAPSGLNNDSTGEEPQHDNSGAVDTEENNRLISTV